MGDMLSPFPIIIDVSDDPEIIKDLGINVHYYVGGPRTAELPRVDVHILCWQMNNKMPDYTEDQEFWYTTTYHGGVDCLSCLQWIHA
jgi:hypothetical protein